MRSRRWRTSANHNEGNSEESFKYFQNKQVSWKQIKSLYLLYTMTTSMVKYLENLHCIPRNVRTSKKYPSRDTVPLIDTTNSTTNFSRLRTCKSFGMRYWLKRVERQQAPSLQVRHSQPDSSASYEALFHLGLISQLAEPFRGPSLQTSKLVHLKNPFHFEVF
jgi:hypothetical protein